MNKEKGSSRSEGQKKELILATEEGISALKEAIKDARRKLVEKTLEMGIAASDGDKDYHENFQFRDLQLEVEGPLSRRVSELEAQLWRSIIDKGTGNFNRLFSVRIETPGDNPEVQTIRLVGPLEVNYAQPTKTNGETYISYESPMGRVLLHSKLAVGATYEFEAPIGRSKVIIQNLLKD